MSIETKKMLKRSNGCIFTKQCILQDNKIEEEEERTFNDSLFKYNLPNKLQTRSRLPIYIKEDEVLTDQSTNISQLPLLYVSSDTTLPITCNNNNNNTLHSTSLSLSSTSSNSLTDESTQIIIEKENDVKELYVCCLSYDAEYEGDLSIKFSDRVYLIKELNEYALVKHMQTLKYGYVPKACLIKVKQFLSLLSI
jgi:hypothetical protein